MTAQARPSEDAGGSEVVVLQQRVPFTMIDNPIIRESTDYVALGMYVDLMSYPPGRKINLRDIAKVKKQGRTVLTDAMNSLIARRLVFRVRYQEANGQWKTRTYVCARPVTLDELRGVRAEYRGKCSIETTAELSTALTQGELSTTDASSEVPAAAETAAKALVGPSVRFPALGDPASGEPTVGAPASGKQVPQRQEVKDLDPPPTPIDDAGADRPHAADEKEEEEGRPVPPTDVRPAPRDQTGSGASGDPPRNSSPSRVEHQDTAEVVAALATSWPIGQRDLARIRPAVSKALATLSPEDLVEHLTANTGGVIHPPSVLRARLENLPARRVVQRRRVPWCGRCASESYRWLTDRDGQPLQPCPTCSPQAVRTTTTKGGAEA